MRKKKSQHTEKKVTCRDISVKENYVIRWSKGPKKNLKNAHLNALSTSLNNKLPYVKAPNHNIDLGTLQQNNGHSYLSDT